MLRSMIDNNAILSKCQWLSLKCELQKAKFPLALPLSKGARFIVLNVKTQENLKHFRKLPN